MSVYKEIKNGVLHNKERIDEIRKSSKFWSQKQIEAALVYNIPTETSTPLTHNSTTSNPQQYRNVTFKDNVKSNKLWDIAVSSVFRDSLSKIQRKSEKKDEEPCTPRTNKLIVDQVSTVSKKIDEPRSKPKEYSSSIKQDMEQKSAQSCGHLVETKSLLENDGFPLLDEDVNPTDNNAFPLLENSSFPSVENWSPHAIPKTKGGRRLSMENVLKDLFPNRNFGNEERKSKTKLLASLITKLSPRVSRQSSTKNSYNLSDEFNSRRSSNILQPRLLSDAFKKKLSLRRKSIVLGQSRLLSTSLVTPATPLDTSKTVGDDDKREKTIVLKTMNTFKSVTKQIIENQKRERRFSQPLISNVSVIKGSSTVLRQLNPQNLQNPQKCVGDNGSNRKSKTTNIVDSLSSIVMDASTHSFSSSVLDESQQRKKENGKKENRKKSISPMSHKDMTPNPNLSSSKAVRTRKKCRRKTLVIESRPLLIDFDPSFSMYDNDRDQSFEQKVHVK